MPFLLPLLPVLAAAGSGAGAVAGGIVAGAAIGATTATVCNKGGERSESKPKHPRRVEIADEDETECEEANATPELSARQKKVILHSELKAVEELLSALKKAA